MYVHITSKLVLIFSNNNVMLFESLFLSHQNYLDNICPLPLPLFLQHSLDNSQTLHCVTEPLKIDMA